MLGNGTKPSSKGGFSTKKTDCHDGGDAKHPKIARNANKGSRLNIHRSIGMSDLMLSEKADVAVRKAFQLKVMLAPIPAVVTLASPVKTRMRWSVTVNAAKATTFNTSNANLVVRHFLQDVAQYCTTSKQMRIALSFHCGF